MSKTITPKDENLNNLGLTALLYIISIIILIGGELLNKYPYTNPMFAADYIYAELGVAILAILSVVFLFPGRSIGFRKPKIKNKKILIPIIIMLIVSFVRWGASFIMIGEGEVINYYLIFRILLTVLVVGFTEEWMYRGLLLSVLSRKFGLRNGALVALVLFGVLHIFNIAGGLPLSNAIIQFINTIIIGSVFLYTAIETGSILIPIIVHGLYDFMVISSGTYESPNLVYVSMVVTAILFSAGIYCLVKIFRIKEDRKLEY